MSGFDYLTWQWPDIVWHVIPGLVIYQLLGTLRHELAHAVAYWLAGWQIAGFYVLPHRFNGAFYWGRITAVPCGGAQQNIHLYLAPYEVCLLSVFIWVAVARWLPPPWSATPQMAWHMWVSFTALFLVSPIVDTAYNLWKWLCRKSGDFQQAVTYWETH